MKKILMLMMAVFAFSSPVYAQQSGDDAVADANVARLQVRISELEEQIRRLQGLIEQNGFENRQLRVQLEKSSADTEYRLNALEKRLATAEAPASQDQANGPDKLQPVSPAPASGADTTETAAALPRFNTPLEHYNYAFNLVREKKYPESSAAFIAFTKSYPKDPLIGNAWYWLGETYYVRRDYVRGADSFRQGYEAMPTGPKAADNLLKLAMSMNLLKKDREACVILKQITVKFANAGNMKMRAEQEMGAIGCNNGENSEE